MSTAEPHEIVRRLKEGGELSSDELTSLLRLLREPRQGGDICNAIRALGLGTKPAAEHVAAVERYLFPPASDENVAAAIFTLCQCWGMVERYLDNLRRLVTIESWEIYSDAGAVSFRVIGEYLSEEQHPSLYRDLIDLIDKDLSQTDTSEDNLRNQHLMAAYRAICVAIGGLEIRSKLWDIDSIDDIDKSILEEGRRRARVP